MSSATVEANSNNWYYYDAIREGINSKRNDTASVSGGCSLAFSNVVKFVDSFLLAPTRNATQVDALKQFFGATFPIEDDDLLVHPAPSPRRSGTGRKHEDIATF